MPSPYSVEEESRTGTRAWTISRVKVKNSYVTHEMMNIGMTAHILPLLPLNHFISVIYLKQRC